MANTITGRVVKTERATTSYYGNPAFYVTIETADGERSTFRTSTDASIAYAIENSEYRAQPHTFKLTRAWRIYGVER